MCSSRNGGARLLLTPWALAAAVLLVVNDRVWEPTFSNWLTGKLSDVCGLILVTALALDVIDLAGLGGRSVVVACSSIAAAFTWVKCTATGAAGYERLNQLVFDVVATFPGVGSDLRANVVVDPTDLVALPAMVVPLVGRYRRSAGDVAAR